MGGCAPGIDAIGIALQQAHSISVVEARQQEKCGEGDAETGRHGDGDGKSGLPPSGG